MVNIVLATMIGSETKSHHALLAWGSKGRVGRIPINPAQDDSISFLGARRETKSVM